MRKVYRSEWDNEVSGIVLKERVCEPCCMWTTKNLVAFTTGFVEAYENDPSSTLILVHVLCPEYPREVYHIETGLKEPIQHLMWDRESTRLLIIDVSGICKVFEMVKNMINRWTMVHQVDIGSRVVCASWLEQEPKYTYDASCDAKAGYSNILEKFPRRFHRPPLADIAGLCKQGFIAVTEMGIAHVVLLEKGELRGKISRAKFFINRSRVLLGDICFKDDGKVHIVLSTDQRVVEFFILTLRMQITKVDISFEISPCISPHTMSNEEYPTYQIKSVKFSNEGNVDRILICTESVSVICLKYFELKIGVAILQPVLQRMVQNPKQINDKEWSCAKSFTFPGKITCLSLSGMLATGFWSNENIVAPSILLVTSEGTMHRMSSVNFSELDKIHNDDHAEMTSAVTFSPTDTCVFTVTDQGNINVYLSSSLTNLNDTMAVKMTVNLFQYCIATGQTSWDVAVLCGSQGNKFIEQCQVLLKNEMASQHSIVQERTYVAQANIQSDIYKSLNQAYYGAIECRDSILLKSISNYIQSNINLMGSDKESLVMVKIKTLCSRQLDLDLPKLVQLLDAKEVAFSSQLISSCQHMSEWISSYAIHICHVVLSTENNANSKQIISILTIQELKILRELLALLYVWGQAMPVFRPHFLESGSPLEILSQIFKFVSKLCLRFKQGDYSRENISIEDVPMRSHPFMYQNLPLFDPKTGVISQCQFLGDSFDDYVFDSEAETSRSAAKYFHPGQLMDESCIYSKKRDGFFYDGINLIRTTLMKGESLKQCVQCSCLTLNKVSTVRNLLSSWKDQWLNGCFCGGLWKCLDAKKEKSGTNEHGGSKVAEM